MAYQIEVYYQTGDSFGSDDETRVLEMEWETLEGATAALERIEEHWRWYEAEHKDRWDNKQKKAKRPKWHTDGCLYEEALTFDMDNGTPVKFLAPWCGYFERLHGARVIEKKGSLPGFGSFEDRN